MTEIGLKLHCGFLMRDFREIMSWFKSEDSLKNVRNGIKYCRNRMVLNGWALKLIAKGLWFIVESDFAIFIRANKQAPFIYFRSGNQEVLLSKTLKDWFGNPSWTTPNAVAPENGHKFLYSVRVRVLIPKHGYKFWTWWPSIFLFRLRIFQTETLWAVIGIIEDIRFYWKRYYTFSFK